MKFLNILVLVIKKVVRYYGFPYCQEHECYGFLTFIFIFEHTITFCCVCFAGKMPASNILFKLLWVQEDERRIVNPVEKNMDAAGIEPVTSRRKTCT
jgi:hypothetical protein